MVKWWFFVHPWLSGSPQASYGVLPKNYATRFFILGKVKSFQGRLSGEIFRDMAPLHHGSWWSKVDGFVGHKKKCLWLCKWIHPPPSPKMNFWIHPWWIESPYMPVKTIYFTILSGWTKLDFADYSNKFQGFSSILIFQVSLSNTKAQD